MQEDKKEIKEVPKSDLGNLDNLEKNTFPAPFKPKDLWKKFLEKINERKKKKLERILILLEKQGKITNNDVEKLLHVSDATATRYLDELERQNKTTQVGKTGKYTYYQKI